MGHHQILVYGTLKKGEPNHGVITKYDSSAYKFLGLAETEYPYPLVIASRYNIPFLLMKKGTGKKVTGEVYEINDDMLSELDEFENHPEYYLRKREYVLLKKNSEKILVWIYFLPNFKPDLLELPFLYEYSSEGDHGLKYVTSENTTSLDDI